MEHLPRRAELIRIHADVLFSLFPLPGYTRDEAERVRMLHHVDQPVVRVRRVTVFGIRQAGQDFAYVFQIELPLLFDQLH